MKAIDKLKTLAAPFFIPFLFRGVEISDSPDSFYNEGAEFYEALFADRKTDDLDFYLGYAKKTGHPALELACGNARVSVFLAKNGITVYGMDLSSRMLELAKRKINDLPPEARKNVSLIRGDMREIPVRNGFRLVMIPYNSFNHLLENEEHRSSARSVFQILLPGGLLIMEILPHHQYYREGFQLHRSGLMPDGKKRVIMYSHIKQDFRKRLHSSTWYTRVISENGESAMQISKFTRRDIPLSNMLEILKTAGFEIIKTQKGYKTAVENKCLIIARKPGS